MTHDLLVENRVLDEVQYINIVATACSLKEIEWCEQFIDSHLHYLEKSPKNHKNAKALSLALLQNTKENFDVARSLLKDVTSQDIIYVLNRHVLTLKIYFDLDKTDLLLERKKSFSAYLSKKNKAGSINTIISNRNKNFIKALELFVNCKYDDKISKQSISDFLETNKDNIIELDWLKSKL